MNASDRGGAPQRARQVIERLVRDGTAIARANSSSHRIFPVAASAFANCGRQFLDDAGLAKLVEFYPEESQIVLPRMLSEGRQFDLAFVDGNHRFDGVFVDLVYLGRLVRARGIVFVDDYQLPAVARATSFFLGNLDWRLEEVSAADELHQWAVLRTSDVPDARPFDYYVDF